MQDLLKKESEDIRAAEAVLLFCYQVKKWIGTYTAVLGGLDAMVFSGGIGENSAIVRSRICEGLQFMGIELSEKENQSGAQIISTEKSRVKVYVIPTDEELMIAKIVGRVLSI
jgi:acetate kinase